METQRIACGPIYEVVFWHGTTDGTYTTKGFPVSLRGLDVPGPGRRPLARPGRRKTLLRLNKKLSPCASRPRVLKFMLSKVLEGRTTARCKCR